MSQKISRKSASRKMIVRKVEIFTIQEIVYMLFANNDCFCSINHHISAA
jgi:hypothetical protein